MASKRHTRRASRNQRPAGGPLTEKRLVNEKFIAYRKEVYADLKPKNQQERELVDRFAELAWFHKDLEAVLSVMLASPLADAENVARLKQEIDCTLQEVILITQQLSRLQNDTIVLVIPPSAAKLDAMPVASNALQ